MATVFAKQWVVSKCATPSRAQRIHSPKLQFVSNLRLHERRRLVKMSVHGDYLAILGGLGDPHHPHFKKFFEQYSKEYESIFVIPDGKSRKMPSTVSSFHRVHVMDCEAMALISEWMVWGGGSPEKDPTFGSHLVNAAKFFHNREFMVMTHEPPSPELLNRSFPPNVKAWLYGDADESVDYVHNGIHIRANPCIDSNDDNIPLDFITL